MLLFGDSLLDGINIPSRLFGVCDKGGGGDVFSPIKDGSWGISPSFIRFFCFIRRFWNQILTCVSLSCNAPAISMRRARVRYLLKWNSFSNSVNCLVEKFVLPVLLIPPGLWPPGPTPYPPYSTFLGTEIEKNVHIYCMYMIRISSNINFWVFKILKIKEIKAFCLIIFV